MQCYIMIACGRVFFLVLLKVIFHDEVCQGTKSSHFLREALKGYRLENNHEDRLETTRTNNGFLFREALKGHRLENNQLKKVTALSVVECSLECLRKSCCQSVNYAEYLNNMMEQNCELNDAKASTNPEDLTRSNVYTHYEMLDTGNDDNCEVSTDEYSLGSSKYYPGKSCKDIKQHVSTAISKEYWIKPTDSGTAFLVYCEMTLDGGGWTLVYSYTLTDYSHFYSTRNAVTPRPNWHAPGANVDISTEPPLKDKLGAVEYNLWRHIDGKEFIIKSNICDWYKCWPLPEGGCLVHQVNGSISCEHIKTIVTTCTATAKPTKIMWDFEGPVLKDDRASMYRFDGSTSRSFPTHNPCSSNVKNHKTGVANPKGEILIR